MRNPIHELYIGTKKKIIHTVEDCRALKINNEVKLYSKFFDNLKTLVDELHLIPISSFFWIIIFLESLNTSIELKI